MIFTSPLFLFVFFPVVWAAWFVLGRCTARAEASLTLLIAASIVFYGWWHLPNVALLAGSIVVNFALGHWIVRSRPPVGRFIAAVGVTANLALLGVFKYYGFFTGERVTLVLPLAISFFTFTQIAFLVDVSRNEVRERGFLRYCFFVTFFPHLIAGPIVRLQEIQEQLDGCVSRRLTYADFRAGTTLVLIGLAKKILIADTLSPSSDMLYAAASHGQVSAAAAWVGALSFHLQIYFDFSGYTDIAIGLARLFAIRFPDNFNHPYSATSFIDFWRRWHITLSRFLRDYLYIPLGGSRKGDARQKINLMITMVLGGLWHGAGWAFVIWGALHGLALGINHVIRDAFPRPRVPLVVKWVVVQSVVFVAWIFFRARDFTSASNVLHSMVGTWNLHDGLLRAMAGPSEQLVQGVTGHPAWHTGLAGLAALLAIGFVASIWRPEVFPQWSTAERGQVAWMGRGVRLALAAAVLVVVTARIHAGDVIEPFIYFQF